MSHRFTVRALAAAATLVASAACASDTTTAVAPVAAQLARGSTPSTPSTPTAAAVGGTWAGTTPGDVSQVDSIQWSLFLTQRDDRLEGSLIRSSYIAGTAFTGISAVKRGSISGQSVSLEFDRGEGAETLTTFGATVAADGRSMTGFHSRYSGVVVLAKR